jgi:hypothetical protein
MTKTMALELAKGGIRANLGSSRSCRDRYEP